MAQPPQQFCVRWNSYQTNLQSVFPKLLSTENFADVTLACESRQLKCHKVVLSACSAYFERLLVQNPCKHPIIFMKDMRFSEMQSLVEFMYKGEVNVAQDELPGLLRSAEALQIRGLCANESSSLTSTEGATAPPDAPPPPPPPQPHARRQSVATQSDDGGASNLPTIAHVTSQRPNHLQSSAAQNGPSNATTVTSPQPVRKRKTSSSEVNGQSGHSVEGGAVVVAKSGRREQQGPLVADIKEEMVEEDGLYYGELENEDVEFNDQEEEAARAGSSADHPHSGVKSATASLLRVRKNCDLLKLNETTRNAGDSLRNCVDPYVIESEFAKYGFTASMSDQAKRIIGAEDNTHVDLKTGMTRREITAEESDYLKLWLEQNEELEVSLKSVGSNNNEPNAYSEDYYKAVKPASPEVDITPKVHVDNFKSLLEKTLLRGEVTKYETLVQNQKIFQSLELKNGSGTNAKQSQLKKFGKKGKGPLYSKEKMTDSDKLMKSDLEQFLEGKEVSSSGMSRKDLESIMMGKFNPNRRYSNEAMWAALMDVKKGGSIYRAAQTHKVPRKSLRNWMKRCHIKSSFPMPQQLKQFVENNRKQKETYKQYSDTYPAVSPMDYDNAALVQATGITIANYSQFECDFDLGKHFLSLASSNTVSSEDENGKTGKLSNGTKNDEEENSGFLEIDAPEVDKDVEGDFASNVESVNGDSQEDPLNMSVKGA